MSTFSNSPSLKVVDASSSIGAGGFGRDVGACCDIAFWVFLSGDERSDEEQEARPGGLVISLYRDSGWFPLPFGAMLSSASAIGESLSWGGCAWSLEKCGDLYSVGRSRL